MRPARGHSVRPLPQSQRGTRLTVEFVAEGAPAWSPPQGASVGGSSGGFDALSSPAFMPAPFRLPYPVVRLPHQTDVKHELEETTVILRRKRGLAGLLASLHRRVFQMYKFRTMYVDNDDSQWRQLMREQLIADEPPTGGEPGIYKIARDPRVTPVGKLLRQFSIDELPQLWNVVRGEMSLVGPRPYVPWEAELFPAEVAKRFSVRPGMTGLWQVSGRSTVDYRKALQIDVHYVETKSLWLDLRILARTAIVVFDRSGTR